MLDRRLAKLDARQASVTDIVGDVFPIIEPVYDKIRDGTLSVPTVVNTQLGASLILLEPHKHSPDTIDETLALYNDAQSNIMRRWRVYESGKLLKQNVEIVRKSHEGFAPWIESFGNTYGRLKAIHDVFNPVAKKDDECENWASIRIFLEKKSQLSTVNDDLRAHLAQFKKHAALQVCCEKKESTNLSSIGAMIVEILFSPLISSITIWVAQFVGKLDAPCKNANILKLYQLDNLAETIDDPLDVDTKSLKDIADHVKALVPQDLAKPLHVLAFCDALLALACRWSRLAKAYVRARIAKRDKNATKEIQLELQNAIEGITAETEWNVTQDALECSPGAKAVVKFVNENVGSEATSGMTEFSLCCSTLNKSILGMHWTDMYKEVMESRVQAASNSGSLEAPLPCSIFIRVLMWIL